MQNRIAGTRSVISHYLRQLVENERVEAFRRKSIDFFAELLSKNGNTRLGKMARFTGRLNGALISGCTWICRQAAASFLNLFDNLSVNLGKTLSTIGALSDIRSHPSAEISIPENEEHKTLLSRLREGFNLFAFDRFVLKATDSFEKAAHLKQAIKNEFRTVSDQLKPGFIGPSLEPIHFARHAIQNNECPNIYLKAAFSKNYRFEEAACRADSKHQLNIYDLRPKDKHLSKIMRDFNAEKVMQEDWTLQARFYGHAVQCFRTVSRMVPESMQYLRAVLEPPREPAYA